MGNRLVGWYREGMGRQKRTRLGGQDKKGQDWGGQDRTGQDRASLREKRLTSPVLSCPSQLGRTGQAYLT